MIIFSASVIYIHPLIFSYGDSYYILTISSANVIYIHPLVSIDGYSYYIMTISSVVSDIYSL